MNIGAIVTATVLYALVGLINGILLGRHSLGIIVVDADIRAVTVLQLPLQKERRQ